MTTTTLTLLTCQHRFNFKILTLIVIFKIKQS